MKPIVETARHLMSKKASDLLLVGGVGCILFGGGLAIKQTPKALKLLEDKKEEETIEKVKSVAPLYIPALLLTGAGIAQIVCSRNMTNNKIAAMATAYTVSETAFKTYREKVKEVVEPDKYEEIKREVAAEKMRRDPIDNKEVIIQSEGNVLIYDSMSGRYLKSNMNEIDRAVNLINMRLRNEMTMKLNDFYVEIGLDIVKMGCELGWDIEKEPFEISYTSTIASNGQPCLVMEYDVVVI